MDKIKKIKIFIGLVYLVILSIFLYFLFHNFNFEDINSIKVIRSNQDRLNMLKENNLILLISIFFLLSVLWVVLLGFGSPIALIGGFIFGKWIGTIIVTTALSIGALCLYIFAKYFLYDFLKENLFTKFKNLNLMFQKKQLLVMILFRFVGFVPFFLANLLPVIFGINTKAGRWFDLILLSLIIISVIGVILSSDVRMEEKYAPLLYIAEWAFTILFTIEYILRVYSAPNRKKYIFSFMGVVDLLAIIPTYMMFIYPPIKYLLDIRVIRLIRIFRILKLTNYVRGAYTMQIALRSSRPKIIVFLLSIFIVVIIVGTLMYIIEGPADGFNNIAESIYWAIVTLTTVGYGNIVPVTVFGKILASFIMILGYAIIAVPTGIVSAEFSKNKEVKKQQENQFKILEKENKLLK